jgi:hypothetical protein
MTNAPDEDQPDVAGTKPLRIPAVAQVRRLAQRRLVELRPGARPPGSRNGRRRR